MSTIEKPTLIVKIILDFRFLIDDHRFSWKYLFMPGLIAVPRSSAFISKQR